ncbi:MAG: MbcA/ParS/Xre antitoxin family protein [Ignavibacteria bacterium]|nr:MbcA/ParS/Xre antitoxin family protein [Ignavibacteria bacterium]
MKNNKTKKYAEPNIKPSLAKDISMAYITNSPMNIFPEINFEHIKKSRLGIAFNEFIRIVKESPFSINEWAEYIHLSERSMLRYKTDKKKFSPINSEKIIKLEQLIIKANDVFGDAEKAKRWFHSPNRVLGSAPVDLLDTSFGIDKVTQVLGRIEYGIYS